MQTVAKENTKHVTEVKNRRKLTVSRLDLAKQSVGFTFNGKYLGLTQGSPFKQVDQKTGEIMDKIITSAVFENPDTNERFSVHADAGLKGAITDAMVKEGMLIEVVKLDKIKLKGGRTMNQYDIYAL